ncbi:MAG: hypothetical protein ABL973_11280 [Micropepsaceae bacterium]
MTKVPRMEGAAHLVSYIPLSDGQVDELGILAGMDLSPFRDQLDIAINDYCILQTVDRESPRSSELSKQLEQLRKHCALILNKVLVTVVDDLTTDGSPYTRADKERAEVRNRIMRESLQSLIAPYRKWDLNIWDFFADVEKACEQGLAALPNDRGGRQDGQSKFPELVAALADIFVLAGREPALHWDSMNDKYVKTPFFEFVTGVNAILPPHLRVIEKKRATTLPKIVVDTLGKWRKFQKE